MERNHKDCTTCHKNGHNTCIFQLVFDIFMAHRAIPIIAFHRVESYIYIYMFASLARLCVVYVVKEDASFPGARSINGRGA